MKYKVFELHLQDLGSSMGLWLGLGVIQAVETFVMWMGKVVERD